MVMHPEQDGVAIASLTNFHIPANGFVEIEAIGAPERTSNARLIAAAPDLLEALESAKWMLSMEYINDDKLRIIEKCEKAIAKAKGQPQ